MMKSSYHMTSLLSPNTMRNTGAVESNTEVAVHYIIEGDVTNWHRMNDIYIAEI